jgi:hypothetical protein
MAFDPGLGGGTGGQQERGGGKGKKPSHDGKSLPGIGMAGNRKPGLSGPETAIIMAG